VARLHWGVAKGARGEAFADLTIARATGGMLSGSVALTAEQVDALRAGRLYIQVHSEKGVPDGGTSGWLADLTSRGDRRDEHAEGVLPALPVYQSARSGIGDRGQQPAAGPFTADQAATGPLRISTTALRAAGTISTASPLARGVQGELNLPATCSA
jgi:hypothetical protein